MKVVNQSDMLWISEHRWIDRVSMLFRARLPIRPLRLVAVAMTTDAPRCKLSIDFEGPVRFIFKRQISLTCCFAQAEHQINASLPSSRT